MNTLESNFKKKDITENVEVLEDVLSRFGVKISGIYCELEKDEREYIISLNGEILGLNDVEEDFELKIVCYDNKNRVIYQDSKIIFEDRFEGFDTFEFFESEIIQIPKKVKIFATKS